MMSHLQLARTAPAVPAEKEPVSPFIIDCQRNALDHLGRAFREARPLALLIGEGKSGANFFIDDFLDNIEGDVAVARITKPCADAIAGMREIIDGIGFERTDMSLADLEDVFRMFLSLQRAHHRRTIICIEEAQDKGWWMPDGVRHLVELEMEGKFGLMVILSGRPGLNKLLRLPSTMQQSDAEVRSVEVNGASSPRGRLITRMNGEVIQEQSLNRKRTLIGRGKRCDIHLVNAPISRRHALVVNSSNGVNLVDLHSRNGTFVDGRRIKKYTLQDSDVVAIGDCRIEYVAGENR